MDGWMLRFDGDAGGRHVKLYQHSSGSLRLDTVQEETETTEGTFEPDTSVFPMVISEGDQISIEAETADELVSELIKCRFTNEDAREIARHGRDATEGPKR